MRATIRLKLSSAFAVVVLLAVAMSALGSESLWSLNNAITRLIQGPVARINAVGDLNVELLLLQRAEHNLIMTRVPAEIKAYDNEVLARRQNVLRLRANLERIGTAETRRTLKEFDADWRKWMPVEEQIRTLSYTNTIASNAHAAVLSMSQGRPLFDSIQRRLDRLNHEADVDLATVDKDTHAQYVEAISLLLTAAAAVLAVSVGAAILISMTIMGGLAKIRSLAEAVAVGDLDHTVEVRSDDEIKDLVGVVNTMTDNLRATATLADRIAGGDLTLRPKALSERDTLGVSLQRMVERLRSARDAQTELTRLARVSVLGEFAASIAHEINQPLAAIVTNSDASLRWLAHEPSNVDQAREAIKRTLRDANRASEVIARLRALVSKDVADFTELDLNDAIREVLVFTQSELQKSQVSVQTDLAGDLPLIQGDRIQVQQVMLNLITNGIEAMRATAARARSLIIRSASAGSDEVEVSVEDRGAGLDLAAADRLFERFFTTKVGGTGLGLAISRSIVEAHGGRIWVEAAVPNGAVFKFTVASGARLTDAAQRRP